MKSKLVRELAKVLVNNMVVTADCSEACRSVKEKALREIWANMRIDELKILLANTTRL